MGLGLTCMIGSGMFGVCFIVLMRFCSWNVRGLNDASKRRMVKEGIFMAKSDIIGLQETKLFTPSVRRLKAIGGNKIQSWACLDCTESRGGGGVLVGWSDEFTLLSSYIGIFSVSVCLLHRSSGESLLFTSVYAPIDKEDKEVCWWELKRIGIIFQSPGSFVVISMSPLT